MNNLTIVNTNSKFAKYKRVENALAQRGMGDPSLYIIQEKTLRVEALLSTTKDTYEFNLYETPNAGREQEIKLNRNDLFFVSHIGLYVYKQDASLTPAQYGNSPLFTYPDPNYFPGRIGGTGTAEWQCLYLLWRGKFGLLTDPVQRIRDMSTVNFLYVPEKQYLEAAFVGITNANFPEFGQTLEKRGLFELSYMPGLNGGQNNRITLQLGSGNKTVIDGAVDAAGNAVTTRNVLQIVLHGYNVENGAEPASKWEAAVV